MGRSRKWEWTFWNLAVCLLWFDVLRVLPDAWPAMFLVLPLQAATNFLIARLLWTQPLSALVLLGGVAVGAEWILILRYHTVWIAIAGLAPLCRVLWRVWLNRRQLFAKEAN